ncbi:MAG TPA: RNA polymerase sigma factor [Bryobacteraceae bacterium]|nr:RNA polymerase sigma factor [Bryobacteraceae bacterium]
MIASYWLEEQLAAFVCHNYAVMTLQDEVAQLFLEARDDVYRYLMSLGLGPDQAQEGAQEVFVRLYATLKKGEVIQNPRAWIFRVAHNLGLKVRARQGTHRSLDHDLESLLPGPLMDPEESLLKREQGARMRSAIQQLSDQQRRCLFLRMQGLRYPEIGAVLGIRASTVGEFLRRAISRLRKDEL